MITEKMIMDDIAGAIREFGAYTFFDKGPKEIMDLDKYAMGFKHIPLEESAKILLHVAETKEGKLFASSILSTCDDMPELDGWYERPEFESLMKYY